MGGSRWWPNRPALSDAQGYSCAQALIASNVQFCLDSKAWCNGYALLNLRTTILVEDSAPDDCVRNLGYAGRAKSVLD